MEKEKEKLDSKESQWFLENIQKLQNELAKELRIQLVVLDDQGEPVTEVSSESSIARLLKKSASGKKLYNQAYLRAENLITAHSDPVLIKVFGSLFSFWAPVATADGTIIGSVVGGGGPFICGQVKAESFEGQLTDFYQHSDLKQAGIKEEDVLNALKGTPVFEPEIVKRKLAEFGRTVGILTEETELGSFFGQSAEKKAK